MNIVERVRAAKAEFGVKCAKFGGAVSVEILRDALAEAGIPTSARDVFIRGIPREIDLVVPRRNGPEPIYRVLYEPGDVAVTLEVKTSGAFLGAMERVRAEFQSLREAGVLPAYVTVEEQRGHPWAITTPPPKWQGKWQQDSARTCQNGPRLLLAS